VFFVSFFIKKKENSDKEQLDKREYALNS